ncbi:MAG: hypothetical protein J5680_04910 [Neisseriaceae bacterium]|nr:hypothetical protein [Neisseriaceae bacterium]
MPCGKTNIFWITLRFCFRLPENKNTAVGWAFLPTKQAVGLCVKNLGCLLLNKTAWAGMPTLRRYFIHFQAA